MVGGVGQISRGTRVTVQARRLQTQPGQDRGFGSGRRKMTKLRRIDSSRREIAEDRNRALVERPAYRFCWASSRLLGPSSELFSHNTRTCHSPLKIPGTSRSAKTRAPIQVRQQTHRGSLHPTRSRAWHIKHSADTGVVFNLGAGYAGSLASSISTCTPFHGLNDQEDLGIV